MLDFCWCVLCNLAYDGCLWTELVQTFSLVFIPSIIQYNDYLHSIYIVLGVISNLDIIKSIQNNVHRLYAYTMPFYIKDEQPWILVPMGFLKLMPLRYWGTTIFFLYF